MEDSQIIYPSTEASSPRAAPSARMRLHAFPAAPPTLTHRRRGRAWVLSLAVHAGMLALGLWGLGREVIEPLPPVRLVFIEPPPPPPPPPGVPEGIAPAPVVQTPPKVEKPPVVVKPKPQPTPPKRLTVPKKTVPLRDVKPPEPPPVVESSAETLAEQPQGVATGVVGGVLGGVEGGTPGGVVDGRITAPLRLDQVAQPPVVILSVPPHYPEVARRRSIAGRVVLEAIVDREGRIESDITVLQSVAILDNAAIDALRQWRFTPGRDANGQTVRVILKVPIRFVLE